MENISLPQKIEIQTGKNPNLAMVSIQPCHPGYGTTLGNALRRILLSSLPGAAITAFKVKGVGHEFTSIPHVKEDLVEITLNLKQLRLKVFSAEPVKIQLKAKGEKKVTGADIKATSDVEIINPDLLIATLTNKEAELDMELIVSQGRGYVPTEAQNKEGLETDMILIDSIFTPLRNVGFQIENVRVGQMTNYENLILTIETDGTITPEQAINQATQILIDHFQLILDETKTTARKDKKIKAEKTEEKSEETAKTEVIEEQKSEKEIKEPKKRGRKPKKIAEEKSEPTPEPEKTE
ncbi:MAG: DNA-directed RNA polymerase subunit alpha [Candidatus Buchananbacteria bacterium RIFCSPHIGHO2_01_FULL_39_14]|uniref:DNA-directed RNA polymerase subunit alpha n=2 Tax=Candidatus Buchananiibacteriota TaxID=1817903 RepID=A0A1G1YSW1_9BACT|nr:MAG: DNA-directed RNA polymerase subunit alpha [Candidatus Buchananbacteria bacterium RIFCSPHIGHO2_01_FULL_39_14]OGY48881.1 MAG: DNA-directed RNA polymerase subunit alpha [Candidatus Buchananbacteria bacterium RIFCSPHIGHO2_02_FULL_39_17]OGY55443.1 MAG: DNA-directed RNA polymerase subunit alpha [Candidatus Buchananbacteria bacterium RIFCSPLOWO2_01_FULL_40_23b]